MMVPAPIWYLLNYSVDLIDSSLLIFLCNSKMPNKTISASKVFLLPFFMAGVLLLLNIAAPGSLGIMLWATMAIILSILIFRAPLLQKIMWPVFSMAVFVCIDYLYTCILFLVINDLDTQKYLYEDFSWLFICNAFATRFLIACFVFFIARKKIASTISNKSWLIFLSVPSLCFIGFLVAYQEASTTKFQGFFFPIIAILLLLLVITSFIQLLAVSKYSYEAAESKAQAKINILQLNQYHRLMEKYEATRGWKHDMKNHLQTTLALIKQKQYDKAAQYIERIERLVGVQTFSICSDNPALDAILGAKVEEAINAGVQVSIKLEIPSPFIDDISVCTLIGNLWDNAIHANIKLPIGNRKIDFIISNAGHFCEIVCQNPKINETNHNAEGNAEHGIGLHQIKNVVIAKYGIYNFENQGNSWKSTIMIPVQEGTQWDKVYSWSNNKKYEANNYTENKS